MEEQVVEQQGVAGTERRSYDRRVERELLDDGGTDRPVEDRAARPRLDDVVEPPRQQVDARRVDAAVARPEKLVAIELEPPRSPALQEFIDKNGFAETVRPYYGVDQTDRAGITEILDREVGTAPLDLVIDDASHQLDLTRKSFDLLFPRVRPGGLYVIEDWGYTHVFEEFGWALEADAGQPHDETPLTALVFELTMAAASRRGLITDITVNRDWAMVRRGPAELDDTFAISAWYGDRGRRLVNGLPPAPAKSG